MRVELRSSDGSVDGCVNLIVELGSRDGSMDRVGTNPDKGSVNVIAQLERRDGFVYLMNLS